jgi:hypothetical protein
VSASSVGDPTDADISRSSLYRRALQTSLSWTVRRDLWRVQALNIRDMFEANKDVTDPRQLSVRLQLLLSASSALPTTPLTPPPRNSSKRPRPPSRSGSTPTPTFPQLLLAVSALDYRPYAVPCLVLMSPRRLQV